MDSPYYMTLEEFLNKDFSESIFNIKFTDADEKFTAGIYKGSREKDLWYDNGGTTVPINDCNTIDEVKARMKIYTEGNYICLRCGKIIPQIAYDQYERFFAGIACKDCWTEQDEIERDWAYRD